MPVHCQRHESMQSSRAEGVVIVFLRLPVEGKVKTRLASGVGGNAACRIYKACAEHVVRVAYASGFVVRCCSSEVEEVVAVREWLSDIVEVPCVCPQLCSPDLGQRMLAAIDAAFLDGFAKVLLAGSDIPGLHSGILRQAADVLEDSDVVFGAAEDGGFYLIGARKCPPLAIFQGTHWSTSSVLAVSQQKAMDCGLKVAPSGCLPKLLDLDTAEDVRAWLKLEHSGKAAILARQIWQILSE